MSRYGTRLGLHGEPVDRVIIVRKGARNTRVRLPYPDKPGFSPDEVHVGTTTVNEDGGVLWEKYHRTSAATWLNYSGEPRGLLKVRRVYKNVIKASLYKGNGSWSNIEDFHPNDVHFDAGQSWPKEKTDQESSTVLETTAPSVENSPHIGQRVSYIRVSTADQNLARQREAIGPIDREFQDKISARSRADRQGLEDCLDYLRAGDVLYVSSIDRLARSLVDLQRLIDEICRKGASVHFIKEHLDFSADSHDPRASLMLGILGSFAEFERSIIHERQAEGIALAKKQGKYKGRKKALSASQVEQARKQIAAGQSKTSLARELGIGRATLYRALDA